MVNIINNMRGGLLNNMRGGLINKKRWGGLCEMALLWGGGLIIYPMGGGVLYICLLSRLGCDRMVVI